MQIPAGQQQRPSAGREWYKQRGGGVTFLRPGVSPVFLWNRECVSCMQDECNHGKQETIFKWVTPLAPEEHRSYLMKIQNYYWTNDLMLFSESLKLRPEETHFLSCWCSFISKPMSHQTSLPFSFMMLSWWCRPPFRPQRRSLQVWSGSRTSLGTWSSVRMVSWLWVSLSFQMFSSQRSSLRVQFGLYLTALIVKKVISAWSLVLRLVWSHRDQTPFRFKLI